MPNNNSVVGVDLKLQANSTLIGTQTGGSLSVSPDLREIILKNTPAGDPTDWKARLSGETEWSVSHEGLLLNGSDEYDLANGNASLKLNVDTTDDSTDNPQLIEVPSLDSIDFGLSQELAETGGLDEALWRYLRPAEREFSIDISGSYIEPTSGDADADSDGDGDVHQAIMERVTSAGGQSLGFELNVFGVTFTGNVALGDLELDAQTGGEDATLDLSMASDLALTKTGSFGSGIDPLFQSFMNKTSVNVGMLHYNSAGPEAGTNKYTGSGYYSELNISMSDGEEITTDGTVEGDGALSIGTV